jgi:lipoprotein-releasing system permease protein
LISKIERVIAFRYLRPKKKEGFLKVISIFSFTGITLGVAILIIVMSVMNGFRTELVNKILGFNPHIIIKPYDKKIHEDDINKLMSLNDHISRSTLTYSGQGILINRENTTGVLVRSYLKDDIHKINLIQNGIIDGSLESFKKNTISIGKELAISLDLISGDEITLMSTSNLQTPFGNLPLQEKFEISSVFSTGSPEFDQNVIFMPFENANSLFELTDIDISLEIFLKKPHKVQLLKASVQKIFNDHYVYSWADLNKSFFGALFKSAHE